MWEGLRLSDGKPVAIKRLYKEDIGKRKVVDGYRIPFEVYLHRMVSHIPGVVGLLDYIELDHVVLIVMEKPVNATDLYYLIEDRMTEREMKDVFAQLVAIVQMVHEAHIVHRDIKENNVLVSTDRSTGHMTVHLIDFGAAAEIKHAEEEVEELPCSPEYACEIFYISF